MFTTSLLKRSVSEGIGTYALVTGGCGAIIVNATTGSLGHLGVACTFGQLIGAVAGATTLQALFGPIAHLGATVPHGSAWQSFDLEVLLTAVLMFVIISVATDTRAVGQLAALAIGATVALDALWAGPISGASMNPARSGRLSSPVS